MPIKYAGHDLAAGPLFSRLRQAVTMAKNKHLSMFLPVKQPFGPRAFVNSTGLMLFKLQGLNLRLFFLSPEVALANIM